MTDKKICTERTTCRVCGSANLLPVIDLGKQFIAGHFVKDSLPGFLNKPYPLELVRCSGAGSCGLVQTRHTVAPSALYYDYGYLSGINEIMRANLEEITGRVENIIALRRSDIVLDIGCNDGTLLLSYRTPGLDRVGFDPADNAAAIARSRGLDVVQDFFSARAFQACRPGGKARAVTSCAMFYDLEDPVNFVRGVAAVLDERGIWVIEVAYLPATLQNNSFDTICHEHLEYYSLNNIEWILGKNHLRIYDLEFNEINGGSVRLFIQKDGSAPLPEANRARLEKALKEEEALALDTEAPYAQFRASAARIQQDLHSLLLDLKKAGKSVYAYGASTKGNTILQFCGIDHTLLAKAADRNPDKWGRRTLGTDIPIVSEEQARAEKPDYFLVLPWHFLEGFVKRETEFLKRGGKFILPIPEVRLAGYEDL